MARFEASDDVTDMLTGLVGDGLDMAISRMLYEGAGEFADALKEEVEKLRVDPNTRYRKDIKENPINVISATLKEDLQNAIGIAKFKTDDMGDKSTAVGFNGYSSVKTKKYPMGIPLVMIARTINSGNSARKKDPFFRRTVNKKKDAVLATMTNIAEDYLKENTNG